MLDAHGLRARSGHLASRWWKRGRTGGRDRATPRRGDRRRALSGACRTSRDSRGLEGARSAAGRDRGAAFRPPGCASPGTITTSSSSRSRTARCRSSMFWETASCGKRISPGRCAAGPIRDAGSSTIAVAFRLCMSRTSRPRARRRAKTAGPTSARGPCPGPSSGRSCVAAGAEMMIAEHDNPSDFDRFVRVSAAAMRALCDGGAVMAARAPCA